MSLQQIRHTIHQATKEHERHLEKVKHDLSGTADQLGHLAQACNADEDPQEGHSRAYVNLATETEKRLRRILDYMDTYIR